MTEMPRFTADRRPSWRLRLKGAAPAASLVGLWVLFFWRFFAPAPADRLMYAPGDFSETFGVFRHLTYQALREGRLPLLADCLYAGYPLHADPQAQLFYPPAWVGYGVLALQGWGHYPLGALAAEVLAHYLFISFTLYAFLRSLALRPAAAVLGAVVFTYGGYLTGFPPLQSAILMVSAWLPLALLFAGRLAQSRSPRHLALTALMLGLAFLAGHPATFVYVAVLVLAYFAFRAWGAGWRPAALLGAVAALGGLAALLAAVQLLPSVMFIAQSTRATIGFDQAGRGFPLDHLVQFFLTGFVSYWHPLYVGVLPLGLAMVGLAQPRREVRFWAGVALVALLLSLGTRGVAYDTAYWLVPGLWLFQGQERWSLLVSFALAVLAAFGAQRLWAPLARPARQRLRAAVRWTVAGLVVALVLLWVVTYLARLGYDPSDWKQLPDRWGVLVVALGLSTVALAARAHAPWARRGLPALWLGVVVLDLFAANRPLNVVPAYDPYPHNPLLEAILTDPGFFRVQDDFQLAGHSGCAYGYQAIEGVTPYRVAVYDRFLQRVPERVRWRLLGVAYVVTWRAELFDAGQAVATEVVGRGSAPDDNGNVTTVHRLPVLPQRAFLVHAATVAAGDAAFGRMADLAFDPFAEAVVDSPVAVEAAGTEDMVEVLHDAPGELRLSVTTAAPALLVVSEAYLNGWTVAIDGAPADTQMAYEALLAAPVPAGQHEVVFTYRSPALGWGAALTLLGLVLVAATAWRAPAGAVVEA